MSNDYEHLSGAEYDRLYAKYLEHPSRILAAPDPAVVLDRNTRMLDLCSGSCSVVKAAIRMGVDPHHIIAVEESKAMTLHFPEGVRVYTAPMNYWPMFDHLEEGPPFDIITCRQAVNYWWDEEIVDRVLQLLSTTTPIGGGAFVFNTFNTRPAEVPQTRQYTHGNHRFAEIAYCIGDQVHHAQARDGLPMHLTTFRWIEPSEFEKPLRRAKDDGIISGWSRRREETTDTYVARRSKGC